MAPLQRSQRHALPGGESVFKGYLHFDAGHKAIVCMEPTWDYADAFYMANIGTVYA